MYAPVVRRDGGRLIQRYAQRLGPHRGGARIHVIIPRTVRLDLFLTRHIAAERRQYYVLLLQFRAEPRPVFQGDDVIGQILTGPRIFWNKIEVLCLLLSLGRLALRINSDGFLLVRQLVSVRRFGGGS